MNTKNPEKIVGVILAGGRGTRMAPFSTHYPKPMLPICNKPLIQYQVDILKKMGIEEVFIVIGHLGYEISRYLSNGETNGVKIHYVEQKDVLGIAHALGQLQPYIDSPFVMLLGDIFFKTISISTITSRFMDTGRGSCLVVKQDEPKAIQKNFAVLLDEETDRVKRVIEKPRYLETRLKGCGLYFFDLPIFDAIRRTPRTAMRDEYEITDSIQILIDDGEPVYCKELVSLDINLTTPSDLLACNMAELNNQRVENIIHDSATIHPQTELTNCVVGRNVTIDFPATLKNCVLFEGTVLENTEKVMENAIITPQTFVEI